MLQAADDALTSALAAHESGRLDEAIARYRALAGAARAPRDAGYLLAVATLQAGEPVETALAQLGRVARPHPKIVATVRRPTVFADALAELARRAGADVPAR